MRNRISSLLLALPLLTGFAAASLAAPVERLDLAPPPLDVKPICVAEERIDELRGKWGSKDKKALEAAPLKDVEAVAKRLVAFDAKANFDLAERLIRRLLASKDRLIAAHAGSELVKLYLEAGMLTRENATELLPYVESGHLSGSPHNLYLRGLIYEQGQAVDRDAAKAFELFEAAARANNVDALMKLVELKIADFPLARDIDPALNMTLTVNAMLAETSPEICGRIRRVARLFTKGEYIAQDFTAAAAWLRLAADFGDGDAARELARMHLRNELIIKDNDELLKYLKLGAERGAVAAMVDQAVAYTDGSLLDADLAKAQHWYIKAADLGSLPAMTALLDFYKAGGLAPDVAKSEAILRRIAERSDAPAFALIELAKHEIEERGNAGGREASLALHERAAALGDAEASLELAKAKIAEITDMASFRQVADLLEYAASSGSSDAMLNLSLLNLCHHPSGPQFSAAAAWKKRALDAGNAHLSLEKALAPDADPLASLAFLRSETLSGTADALAYLIDRYDNDESADSAVTWRQRLEGNPAALWRYAKIKLDRDGATQAAPRMSRAAQAGSLTAKVDAAKLMIAGYPSEFVPNAAKIEHVLLEAAGAGRGEAMELLHARVGADGFAAMYAMGNLAEAVKEGGDYRAFLMAARMSADAGERAQNLAGASAKVDCTFTGAMRMAKALLEFGEREKAARWADTAAGLVGDDGGDNYNVGSLYAEIDPAAHAGRIIAHLTKAVEANHVRATVSLLSKVTDPAQAQALSERLMRIGDPKALHAAYRGVHRAGQGAAKQNGAIYDMLRRSAELGNATAMRDYGLAIYRGEFGGAADAAGGMTWIKRAADLGDVTAMIELARAHALGMGVEASTAKAKVLLQKASALGSPEAAGLLNSLGSM